MNEHVATCMQQAIDYLTHNPDQARYTDSAATATLEEGLRVEVIGPNGAKLVTDMPEGVGGGATAPTPGWVMRAALAACDATLIAMRAAQEGIALKKIEVTTDGESDDRGLLGIGDDTPAGPLSTRIRVRLFTDAADQDQLERIVEWAHHHSPVGDAVQRAIPTAIEVEQA